MRPVYGLSLDSRVPPSVEVDHLRRARQVQPRPPRLQRQHERTRTGSLLQVLLILAGLVVPVMFFLGAVFAALWVLAIYLGRRVARIQADRGPQPG